MNKVKLITLLLLCSVILNGADSIVAGYIAQEYKGQHLGKVMIKFNGPSLAKAKYMEDEFKRVLKEYDNVQPYTYLSSFPPTKTYSDKEIKTLLLKHKIYRFLSISKIDSVPSGTSVYATYTSEVRVTQEYYKIEITDLKNQDKIVWIGDIYIWGQSTLADVRKHLIKYLFRLMERDGLIKD